MALLGATQVNNLEFFKGKDAGKTINSFVCVVVLIFLLTYPIFATWFMSKHRANLDTPDFATKFNSLYQTLDTSKKLSIWSTTLFLLRRLILALTIVFLSSHQYL